MFSDDEISSPGWKSQQKQPGFYDQDFQDGLVAGKATRLLGWPTSPGYTDTLWIEDVLNRK